MGGPMVPAGPRADTAGTPPAVRPVTGGGPGGAITPATDPPPTTRRMSRPTGPAPRLVHRL